jgi:hypothetical protein
MRRRLASLGGALAVALVIPFSSAFADSVAPPTGSYVDSFPEQTCNGNLCTTPELHFGTISGTGTFACLILVHTDLELGGAVYETESGCGDPSTVYGALVMKSGFVAGIAATTITLGSSLGGQRAVTFSANYLITGDLGRATVSQVFNDTPNPGCTTSYTSKEHSVSLITGALTIGGDPFDASGVSTNRQARFKVRC